MYKIYTQKELTLTYLTRMFGKIFFSNAIKKQIHAFGTKSYNFTFRIMYNSEDKEYEYSCLQLSDLSNFIIFTILKL